MAKTIRFVQNYLMFAFPFVAACMLWETAQSESEILKDASFITKALWELLAWNLMLWFSVLILFLFMLVVAPSAREKTLKRLANLKERDEREEYITGKASRSAYISTLSLLILFLFLSIFNLKIYRAPESEVVAGKRGTVAIGLQFDLLDQPRVEKNQTGQVFFESKDIPLSKTAIILVLLVWQLTTFNFTARKEQLLDS